MSTDTAAYLRQVHIFVVRTRWNTHSSGISCSMLLYALFIVMPALVHITVGTIIHRVLLFMWVLLFRKVLMVTVSMGIHTCEVMVYLRILASRSDVTCWDVLSREKGTFSCT